MRVCACVCVSVHVRETWVVVVGGGLLATQLRKTEGAVIHCFGRKRASEINPLSARLFK